MAKPNPLPERKIFVTISDSTEQQSVRFETWKYWEILGELIFRSADRTDACDAAKWCARTAKPGDRRELFPDITLEVADG